MKTVKGPAIFLAQFIDKNPENPSYVAVDYAIVGTLSEEEQFQIGRMLVAVIGRNFKEVANMKKKKMNQKQKRKKVERKKMRMNIFKDGR